jgi:citrate lyase subunit beta/citryl-CoA lyase
MLLRSLLFVPGTRPDRFAKAMTAGADAVVFDLEDAVDPRHKAEARDAVGAFLDSPATSPALRLVRVNQHGSPWIADDLAWLARTTGAAGVLVPKVESAEDLAAIAAAAGARPIIPLVETARGILRASAIASGPPSIRAICLGAEDLTAEMRIPRTPGGDEILVARSLVSLAATAAGVLAIDAVFTNVADTSALETDARRARALGFGGKMAIHPTQIAVIHGVFSPTSGEIDRAQRIVDADADARAQGQAVARLDDHMIDAPVVARAKRILELADAIGRRA